MINFNNLDAPIALCGIENGYPTWLLAHTFDQTTQTYQLFKLIETGSFEDGFRLEESTVLGETLHHYRNALSFEEVGLEAFRNAYGKYIQPEPN